MDDTSEKIDKILSHISTLQLDTALIYKDVAQNTKDLTQHIKRTNLLESRIEQHAIHHEGQLEEALIPIRWAKTTLKVIAAALLIVTFFTKVTGGE